MGHLLFFAGGRLMSAEEMSRVAPGAELFGPSRLPGHTAEIDGRGTLVFAPSLDASVWGVLWMVPAEHLARLDDQHGVGNGLGERLTLRVVSPVGPHLQAICYRSVDSGGVVADSADWPLLIRAARENRLPDDYQKRLARLAVRAAEISR